METQASITNAQLLPVIAWGLLGSLFLLVLHRLIAQAFPKPSAGVFSSAFRAQQPPPEESGDGMAEVYAFDASLMDSEFERPGSTFWFYYRQPVAVIARLVGSLLVSFTVASWALGIAHLACGSIFLFLMGLGFSFYPYQTWWMSRPRLIEK